MFFHSALDLNCAVNDKGSGSYTPPNAMSDWEKSLSNMHDVNHLSTALFTSTAPLDRQSADANWMIYSRSPG